MKKAIFTIVIILGSIVKTNSQAFEQGRSYISAGYGVITFSKAVYKVAASEGNYKYSSFGPVYLKYEYGITENLGLGANIAYLNAIGTKDGTFTLKGNSIPYTEKIKYSSWSVLARLNYHLIDNDRIDPYIGIGLGYRHRSWRYAISDPLAPIDKLNFTKTFIPLGLDATLGCRFLLTDNFGFYTEVGIAKSFLQFGLTAKF